MSIRVVKVEPTPNPNARKFVLARRIWEDPRSYFNADAAQRDPIASRLFAIDGVSAVLLLHDFITISKTANADWKPILAAARAVLRASES